MEGQYDLDYRDRGKSLSVSYRCRPTYTYKSLVLGIAPSLLMLPFSVHKTRQKHLETASDYSKVRAEAMEEGEERRQSMKYRVKETKPPKDARDGPTDVNA